MLKNLRVLVVILQLQKVWNIEQRARQLDIRPSFINLPKYLIPHHIVAAYRQPSHSQHITSNHIQVIGKKRDNINLVQQHISSGDNRFIAHPGQATSNMHHTSIHTDIKHFLTNDNVQVPIVTQTVTHTATNITHPSKMASAPVLVQFHPNQFVQEYRTPFHDLSVIPLHRSRSRSHQKKLEREADSYEEDSYGARFRNFYGGFGTGLTYGGHGAGHGFYAYG